MRRIGIGILFLTLGGAVSAQQTPAPPAPAVPMKTFASAADISALIAKAKSDHKPGQPTTVEPILHLAPYTTNLEYRTAVGPAAVHEKEAEIFYVLDGSGTITTGGKLTNESRTNPENLTGTAIEAGTSRNVAKGDTIIVPENTPHQFTTINGTLILMSMHVPRTETH